MAGLASRRRTRARGRDRWPDVGATAAARYTLGQAHTTKDGDLTEMNSQTKQDERIAKMIFASVYPHYVNKVVKKERSEQELQEVIAWLTGFTKAQIKKHIMKKSTFEDFFDAAELSPYASSIKGVICGYRVEEIENPLTQKVRYLDKLVDELARGKKMEKILRS